MYSLYKTISFESAKSASLYLQVDAGESDIYASSRDTQDNFYYGGFFGVAIDYTKYRYKVVFNGEDSSKQLSIENINKTGRYKTPNTITPAIGGGAKQYFHLYRELLNNPPTLSLTSPANNQTLSEGQTIYTGNNDFTIRLTADDADPADTLEYQIKLNGVIKRNWTPITRNTPVDYTFLKADYTKDRNSFTVTVRDSQGGQTVFNGYLDKVQGLPVNVVSSAYLVSRMSPPVRLNNGWLVGCVIDNGVSSGGVSYSLLYVSRDNGKTWTYGAGRGWTTGSFSSLNSMVTNGKFVYLLFCRTTGPTIYLQKYDPETNAILETEMILDSDQTAINSVSIAITPDSTKLWWAA
ncbi:hypothetical protein EDM54_24395, partial [Brevibacillus borstelensis]